MKLDNRGFTLIEGLLIVIALTLMSGVGYYVYDANKDKKPAKSTQDTSRSESEQPKAENSDQQLTEDEKILLASNCKDAQKCTILEKSSTLAYVEKNFGGGGTHAYLSKESNEWKVVWEGNGDVPQDIVSKYSIPESWLGPQI